MEPIDIWRSALLVIQLHGDLAPEECRRRSAALRRKNDPEAAATWEAMARAAESMLKDGPPQDVV